MHSTEQDSLSLAAFLHCHPRLLVLTGAGISQASGIPTYRDTSGTWQHSEPMTHQAFLGSPRARRRYWLRSCLGWPVMRDARPNRAHLALAQLESSGRVELLVTQNVDRLHQRAGSSEVVDLHGRLDLVRCLGCGQHLQREAVQRQLERLGYGKHAAPLGKPGLRPDGDVDAEPELDQTLPLPHCPGCHGDLMPAVVFFGGAIPGAVVRRCHEALERATALLVVGSSLQVYSGYRFCRLAAAAGKPVALINPGVTRADPIASEHWYAPAATVLPQALEQLRPQKKPAQGARARGEGP